MIYDSFLLFNELDLLEIRLNCLDSFVDKFVLVESPQTFTGKKKPLYFNDNRNRFEKFLKKIIYVCSPEMETIDPWEREAFQRNQIMNGLVDCLPDDVIMISDIDEIPKEEAVNSFLSASKKNKHERMGMNQVAFLYYLNGLWSRKWMGTSICYYHFLNTDGEFYRNPHAVRLKRRAGAWIRDAGWHFTFLGGAKAVMEKVDAYSEQQCNVPEYMNEERIKERMENDWVEPGDRNRTVVYIPIDDSFPEYIVKNQEKYKHLIKSVSPELTPEDCTVIVTSSFVSKCHPCTEAVVRSISSLTRIFGLLPPNIIFSMDFDEDSRYFEYKNKIRDTFREYPFIEATEHIGFQGVLKQAVDVVQTPLILVWQHDFEMIEDVPFNNIAQIFMHPKVKYLRIAKERVQESKWNMIVDEWQRPDIRICATSGWSDNPHFARTDHYKEIIIPLTKPMGESLGVETMVWPAIQEMIAKSGFEETMKKFGVYIYGKKGSEPVTRHLIIKRGKKPICAGELCEKK